MTVKLCAYTKLGIKPLAVRFPLGDESPTMMGKPSPGALTFTGLTTILHRMAVFVDGGFFLKRIRTQFPRVDHTDPRAVADLIHSHALRHKTQIVGAGSDGPISQTYDLYRIFFYDCPPLEKKMHYPISQTAIDFAKSDEAVFRRALHNHLRQKRKVALRLGHLLDATEWKLKPGVLKELTSARRAFATLTDADFTIDTTQKGVDMRLGLDVASLAYKRFVDQIVLIVGDSDFVPAAKLARREGIDVILDRLGSTVHPSLNEHIDGVRTFNGKARSTPATAIVATETVSRTTTVSLISEDDA